MGQEGRRDDGAVVRAAICRFGGVGDCLIAASVLPHLKAKYGAVDVLASEPYHAVFGNNPHVDRIILPDQASVPKAPREWQGWFDARSKEYDFFVNLSHSVETLGALQVAQTAFWWPAEYRRKLCDHNYLELAHDICGAPHEFGPMFFPTDEEREQVEKTRAAISGTSPFVAWCLGGSRIDKVYPNSPMVIARLIRELGHVVVLGAPGKDAVMSNAIAQFVMQENGSLAGFHAAISTDEKKPNWPIRRIIATAQAAKVVIGPDTGPMWGVAMEANSKVVLLSHASPTNITKHWKNTSTFHAAPQRVDCWPCHRLQDDPSTCRLNAEGNGAACISDIPVSLLVNEITRLFRSPFTADIAI